MRLAWLTDIHLDFLDDDAIDALAEAVRSRGVDGALVTGDISVANRLRADLGRFASTLGSPVHFVLGNHDFYGSSVAAVRRELAEYGDPRLRYLPDEGVVGIGATALVGVDGVGDGRLGDPMGSDIMLNDFIRIKELAGLRREQLVEVLQQMGADEAVKLKPMLTQALAAHERVIVATHVPPFHEACLYKGELSDDRWLPWFTCHAVGQVLLAAAKAHPARSIEVYCGHTHSVADARLAPNLRVHTGPAEYGAPHVQCVLDLG